MSAVEVYVLAYLIGWFLTASVATERIGSKPSKRYCHNVPREDKVHYCRPSHGRDCWRSDPPGIDLGTALDGAVWGLVWPLVVPVASVLGTARLIHRVRTEREARKPDAKRIALLEELNEMEQQDG